MHATLIPLAEILKTNNSWYLKAFEQLDEESGRKQFSPETNNTLWLFGHLATMRYHMAQCMGLEDQAPWGELFWQDIKEHDQSTWPKLSEFKMAWLDISERIMSRIQELNEKDLKAAPPSPFPEDGTCESILTFLVQHESYHIGQLSYIRRLLKLEGL